MWHFWVKEDRLYFINKELFGLGNYLYMTAVEGEGLENKKASWCQSLKGKASFTNVFFLLSTVCALMNHLIRIGKRVKCDSFKAT